MLYQSMISKILFFLQVIAILIGANDIQGGNSVTVLKKLQALCEKIHEENPGYVFIKLYSDNEEWF